MKKTLAHRLGSALAAVLVALVPVAAQAQDPAPAGPKPSSAAIEQALFDFYELKRGDASIVRVENLDEIARSRATDLAGMEHEARFTSSWDLGEAIQPTGIKLYRAALSHSDMLLGYTDPALRFQESWSGQAAAWQQALNPQVDAVGIGAAQGDDAWWILVVVMLEGTTQEFDVPDLEKITFKLINRERKAKGLNPLKNNVELAAVARAHSEDMVRRGYFDHKNPEGELSSHRVRAAGMEYSMVGENIFKAWGVEDVPTAAAAGWMDSPGHRENILTADYTESGMGVAVSEEGAVIVTQLFFRPTAGK